MYYTCHEPGKKRGCGILHRQRQAASRCEAVLVNRDFRKHRKSGIRCTGLWPRGHRSEARIWMEEVENGRFPTGGGWDDAKALALDILQEM